MDGLLNQRYRFRHALKFNRLDITAADTWLPESIPPRTLGVMCRVDRLAIRKQWEMSLPQDSVVGERRKPTIAHHIDGHPLDQLPTLRSLRGA
jgi:hypothetical protein